MNKKSRVLVLFLIVCLLGFFVGCDDTDSAEDKDAEMVNDQQNHYQISQPLPKYDYSLEREIAIKLYNMRNTAVRTWSVWRSDYGMIEGWCESLGFPIPYDVQLTNPVKMTGDHRGNTAIEQAEPNGLFSSKNTAATWVLRVNEDGSVSPVYIESKVTCYSVPIKVDWTNNRVVFIDNERNKPSVKLKIKGRK